MPVNKLHLILLFLNVLLFQSFAQRPAINWYNMIGTGSNNIGMSVQLTHDNGYIVTGHSGNYMWLFKTDMNGAVIWEKLIDTDPAPESLNYDYGNVVGLCADNGFIIAGETYVTSGNRNILLVRTDSNGDTLWTKEYDFNLIDYCKSMQILDDGFIIAGNTIDNNEGTSSLLLMKVDQNGNTNWTKQYGGINEHYYEYVQKTSDNGFIIGVTGAYAPGENDVWLLKTDNYGDTLWTKIFPGGYDNLVSGVFELADSSYIIAASTILEGEYTSDILLIKTDPNGNTLWSYTYGSEAMEVSSAATITKDMGLIFVGTKGSGSNSDIYLQRVNEQGQLMWTKRYAGNRRDEGVAICNSAQDTYVLLATTESYGAGAKDAVLMKIKEEENIINFTGDPVSGAWPLKVQFYDSSKTYTNSWQWDFENDGIVDSYIENPSFTYFIPDTYSVKLIIKNDFSADTLLRSDYIFAYTDSMPNILAVEDIPDDQGGWVKVQFAASSYDTDSLVFPKAATAELYTVEIDDGSGWTAAATTAAYGKSQYSVLVPTTKDSTAESDGLINFRVIAAMSEGNYVSEEMTGYSVDNLAPAVPQGLLAKQSGNTVEMSWQENNEDDFKYYTIYRGTDGSELQVIKTTIQPVFNDESITAGHDYSYALSATDHSGNESALSVVFDLTVTGLENGSAIPDKYYLGQNFPNPFNPTTTITFGLKESTKVRLLVYNILGNQVTELLNSVYPAGRYQIKWDGTNSFGAKAGTGIYYYKLETENYTAARKMIYIK